MTTSMQLKVSRRASRVSASPSRVSTARSVSSSKNRFDRLSSKSPNPLQFTPVAFSRIKFFPYNLDEFQQLSQKSPKSKVSTSIPEHELYVNLNCSIRILMEYVRNEANIPETVNFDLFDEMGNMKLTFNLPANTSANTILLQNAVYFIVVIPKHEPGLSMKPYILINRGARLNADYMNRVRRQIQSKKYAKFASAS
ncbi:uncharacterized protein CXorf65 homolog [Chrysoperla carnea]|uniref:uncharacterized protein CXorf65 homolog n=1 Tax=Chrysoperla carnea TaxID=189513 RepID=UPI001D0914E0|nr:uncharacterized protein CXorf65 homolog [Chrysoperla carnea]